jgi:3-oxoacyl-[acyl-carrier protein] reductase
MDLGLNGRVALVFGAGGGLGGAIASSLAREGASVVVADIAAEAAGITLRSISDAGGKAMALTWDLADLSSIAGHLARIEAEMGPVDILVNNTGGPPPTTVSGQAAQDWEKFFHSMVLPVISITDAILPGMKARNWGRIITSTSSGVVAPIANLGLSNTLRTSLVAWSKTLAGEVGRHGVTSNIVLPGRIATQRITFLDEQRAKREGKTVEAVTETSTNSIPIGRYGRPEEYGDTVAFLASTRASYITGSVIRVDGGLIPSI